jgi:hypothetical protein
LFLSLIFVLAFTASGIYAFSLTFGQFRFYDDEGYLMLTVRGLLEGNSLYDSVATYYGPVYYFYEWAVHGLASVPLTNDATRVLTVIHWITAAAIIALACWRMTKSVNVALLAFVQSVVHLTLLSGEPGHPQEIVVVLLAVAAFIAARGVNRRWTLGLLGGIGAALVFTKVNIGGFFGFSLLLALGCYAPISRSHRRLFGVALVLASAVPFLVMHADLGERWVWYYSWQCCASLVATGCVAFAFAGPQTIGLSRWFPAGAVFCAVAGIVIVAVLLTGSSLSAIVRCLVLEPAMLRGAFSFPLHIEHCSWSAAAAILAAVVVIIFKTELSRWRLSVALAKCAYGLLGALVLVDEPKAQLGYLLPWAWLILMPTSKKLEAESIELFPRVLLCLSSVWQGIQAYPVGGTQVAVGTFLAVAVYSLSLHDGVSEVASLFSDQALWTKLFTRRSGAFQAVLSGFLLSLFTAQWIMPLARWREYFAQPPMDLSGARWIRADPFQANNYVMLTRHLARECDTFITIPGLNSLYFWTGKRPPTYIALCGEGLTASEGQQTRVVDGLKSAKQPLIVLWQSKWSSEARLRKDEEGPLLRFIHNECRQIDTIGPYLILAPNRQSNSLLLPTRVHPGA